MCEMETERALSFSNDCIVWTDDDDDYNDRKGFFIMYKLSLPGFSLVVNYSIDLLNDFDIVFILSIKSHRVKCI